MTLVSMVNSQDGETKIRTLYLTEELRMAMHLFDHGCSELLNISYDNDQSFIPLRLLSDAVERFLKCILYLHLLNKEGNYPTVKESKNYGHNITELFQLVQNKLSSQSLTIQLMSDDYSYLKEDEHLLIILEGLQDFAKDGRYYNLDYVCAGRPLKDYRERWFVLERTIGEDLLGGTTTLPDNFYIVVNQRIVNKLERMLSALARSISMSKSMSSICKGALPSEVLRLAIIKQKTFIPNQKRYIMPLFAKDK